MSCEHNPDNEAVTLAAMWLADERQPPKPLVPTIKSRFGLSAPEACEAIALANKFRTYRKAFG